MEEEKNNPSTLDEIKKATEELKAENNRREELLEQEKKIQAERILSGTGEAPSQEKPKEETAQEYKDRVMRGEI